LPHDQPERLEPPQRPLDGANRPTDPGADRRVGGPARCLGFRPEEQGQQDGFLGGRDIGSTRDRVGQGGEGLAAGGLFFARRKRLALASVEWLVYSGSAHKSPLPTGVGFWDSLGRLDWRPDGLGERDTERASQRRQTDARLVRYIRHETARQRSVVGSTIPGNLRGDIDGEPNIDR
jgi:hypothetical protein